MNILRRFIKQPLSRLSFAVASLLVFFLTNSVAAQDAPATTSADSARQAQDLSAQLIDIELPSQPGTNWWFWLEIGLIAVGVLILAGVLYWLRNRYWRRFHLRWQLKKLNNHWSKQPSMGDQDEGHEEALKLFQIFDDAKRHQLLLAEDALILKQTLEPLCFSRSHASRETLVATLDALKQALNAHEKHLLKTLPGMLAGRWRATITVIFSRIKGKSVNSVNSSQGEHHGQ
ncbi:hypothetical protein [Hydrogenovibrio marinus]|uniref:DUF4381 domain-containing protein n=1 Tax=Hydrogenovibrio marinus TaxID=28885 RepID=A0A066ZUP9_HYDMR|nr:hypothetical protein [Hydrogenovibrio marinus]KDN96009.1 hypothetical protein EI16_06900 [Hydrogenovibrio marinus]BBN58496.1 hypothetical protein HVMH_0090 [Hydrogenovibrio marinus]